MSVTVKQLLDILETIAPGYLTETWDNSGLQVGDPGKYITKVMVTLDIDETVVDEAVDNGVDFIVTHHPLIFQPVQTLRFDAFPGKLLKKLVKNEIAVFAAHTNLDNALGGINDVLAELLSLRSVKVLAPFEEHKMFKLVVFVPEGHLERVRNAICRAGAGWIGKYSSCTFSTAGTGTFLPLSGANPFIGILGELEKVQEYRLETIVPRDKLRPVLTALEKAHPYEEVAYDIYPLELKTEKFGLGRVGDLDQAVTLQDLAQKIKDILHASTVRVVGDLKDRVLRIAVCGGSGISLLDRAKFHGADCFVTGDVKYHQAQHAREIGLAVIDAGHYETEAVIIPHLIQRLQKGLSDQGFCARVLESKSYMNPLRYV